MSWPARVILPPAVSVALGALLQDADMSNGAAQSLFLKDAVKRVDGFSQLVDEVRQEVAGRGACVVVGVPDDDPLLVLLAGILGEVTPIDNGPRPGHLVRSLVSDLQDPVELVPMPLHTDTVFGARKHDSIGLYCVKAALDGGGTSNLARSADLVDAIRRIDPVHLVLLQDSCFPFVKEKVADPKVKIGPVLAESGGLVSMSYHPKLLAAGLKASQIELGPAHRAALECLERVIGQGDVVQSVFLAEGDLLLIDNHTVLHGRDALTPRSGPRHLKRLKMYAAESHVV